MSVSVPYEITLLSNSRLATTSAGRVSVPYEITLLSNTITAFIIKFMFQYLMKLHYSQTSFYYVKNRAEFQYLMKLHYSQT